MSSSLNYKNPQSKKGASQRRAQPAPRRGKSYQFNSEKIPFAISEESSRILHNTKILNPPALNSSLYLLPKSAKTTELNSAVYSLRSLNRRIDIQRKGKNFHFARAQDEHHAEAVLELFSQAALPYSLRQFNPPVAMLKSSQENLFHKIERTYLISPYPKKELPLSSLYLANSSKRVKTVGKILFDLSHLHGLGLVAGDTSIQNISISKNGAAFRSPSHIRAMGDMGEGISEALLFLCHCLYKGYIKLREAIHLIRHYLASDSSSCLHAKYYVQQNKSLLPKKKSLSLEQKLLCIFNLFYSKYYSASPSG